MRIAKLCIILLIFNSCTSQENDHSKLEDVYAELIEVWKTKNDKTLKDFCYKLIADETTQNYMEKNNLCYRGFPCEMKNKEVPLEEITENLFNAIYPSLKQVRNKLSHDGILENLTHVDTTNYDFASQVVVIINQKEADALINQYQKKLSINEYNEILAKSNSLQKPIEELLIKTDSNFEYESYKIRMTYGMLFKSNDKTYAYQIGEMTNINNKWYLFSTPREEYNLID
ncbi:hypothetical protein GCM10011344_05090 [Dokdonia pacifica]|uniref:Uncharacterized protein n=1 Tax=Dokdonia pacifica TaxID=1627892 RepID=A0A238ZMW1_9FLAO|nr:hypothetical protein [Dokdonia pacifica]GGG07532.1 hypothetical protein GCM10011344_05090 [Dokdonia pacifica]SNR84707.1 hypothetical protein SAMN06265376_103372 [Dokdonia pacifica]